MTDPTPPRGLPQVRAILAADALIARAKQRAKEPDDAPPALRCLLAPVRPEPILSASFPDDFGSPAAFDEWAYEIRAAYLREHARRARQRGND